MFLMCVSMQQVFCSFTMFLNESSDQYFYSLILNNCNKCDKRKVYNSVGLETLLVMTVELTHSC